jgi:hypothetical protein
MARAAKAPIVAARRRDLLRLRKKDLVPGLVRRDMIARGIDLWVISVAVER